jgi:hypothetical protein
MADETSGRIHFGGFKEDNPDTLPISIAIGGFLGNFSAIESLADAWLGEMSNDEVLVDAVRDLRLSKRIEIIISLIETGRVSVSLADEACTLWAQASTLASVRNQLAHNPIMFGTHETLPFAGVLDRRKKSGQGRSGPQVIEYAEIAAAQNRAVVLAKELYRIGLQAFEAAGE